MLRDGIVRVGHRDGHDIVPLPQHLIRLHDPGFWRVRQIAQTVVHEPERAVQIKIVRGETSTAVLRFAKGPLLFEKRCLHAPAPLLLVQIVDQIVLTWGHSVHRDANRHVQRTQTEFL